MPWPGIIPEAFQLAQLDGRLLLDRQVQGCSIGGLVQWSNEG